MTQCQKKQSNNEGNPFSDSRKPRLQRLREAMCRSVCPCRARAALRRWDRVRRSQGSGQPWSTLAHEHGLQLTEFLPEYDKYGRGAPLIRNKTIIENADYVLAIWDGVSRGTHNAIGHAQNLSKPLLVERFDNK